MSQRPISTLIFGILNIGFGLVKLGWPLVAAAMANLKLSSHSGMAALQSDPAYAALSKFNMWTGVVFGLALLAFGIGLLLLQNWARIGSIVYAVVAIVFVLVGSVVVWPFMKRMVERMATQAPGAPSGLLEGIVMFMFVVVIMFGLAYPLLLLFFMTRSNVIEACQRQEPAPPA
jgi:NADH:ubiquinone oxidoreductase subunit 3 (subunit A)